MPANESGLWDPLIRYLLPFAAAVLGLVGSVFVYKEKVSNIEKNIDRLSQEVRDMRDKVIACETSLKEREPYVKRKSPLALTEKGKDLLTESGGAVFVDTYFTLLDNLVNEKKPKTAYDVQETSRKVLEGLEPDDKFNPLKDYAFKAGLPLETIIEVMGIYLRDKILLKKGWNEGDIDKHDPLQSQNK